MKSLSAIMIIVAIFLLFSCSNEMKVGLSNKIYDYRNEAETYILYQGFASKLYLTIHKNKRIYHTSNGGVWVENEE